jgi:hypothetical protein
VGSRLHLLTLRGNHVKELKITVEIIMPGRYMEIKSKHFGYSESCVSIADSELPVKRGFRHVLCLTLTPTSLHSKTTPKVNDFE